MSIVNVAEGSLAEVRAKLREARDQGVTLEEPAESTTVEGDNEVVQEAEAGASGDEAGEVAGQQFESGAEQREQSQQVDPHQEELKRERQRFETLSQNTHNLSKQNQELQRQFEAQSRRLQEMEEAQRQAETARKQREHELAEQYIRTQVPEHLRDSVRQMYQANLLVGEASAFAQETQAQRAQLEAQRRELELARVRAELPRHIDDIVRHVGEAAEVDTEALAEVTRQGPFQALLAQYQQPRDLAVIAEVLYAVGLSEKGRKAQALQQNRREAVAQGAGVRVSAGAAAAGGGRTNSQRIDAIPKDQWNKFKAELKRAGGNVSAALNSLEA